MPLQFTKHQPVSLKSHPEFNEVWLHDRICDDVSILGLGDLDIVSRERRQEAGGRLDMLLSDPEEETRYVVEIMLGDTDPSHIIRCIEYWDTERRRYPAYDHVAVLVAEEVTSRFLNVMGLLAGSIPMVAIQLNALQVDEQLMLNFTKVLDQRQLREDDTAGEVEVKADRSSWEAKCGAAPLQICDRILAILNESRDKPLTLNYMKRHIGFTSGNVPHNIVTFHASRSHAKLLAVPSDLEVWKARLDAEGIEFRVSRARQLRIPLTMRDLENHEGLVRELLADATARYYQ